MTNDYSTSSSEEKFRLYIEPLFKSLYISAYRLTGSREDAEDLTQETLVKAYKNVDKLDMNKNPGGWLYTIMRNTFLNNIRRDKSRELLLFDGGEVERLSDDRPVETGERAMDGKLQSILNAMPPDMRAILVAREIQGLSYDQIAKQFKIPVGTVKSRLKRARVTLQGKWNRSKSKAQT